MVASKGAQTPASIPSFRACSDPPTHLKMAVLKCTLNRIAVPVREHLAARLQHPDLAVGTHQAVFEAEGVTRLVRLPYRSLDRLPVLRVNVAQKRFVGAVELLGRPAEYSVEFLRPDDGVVCMPRSTPSCPCVPCAGPRPGRPRSGARLPLPACAPLCR